MIQKILNKIKHSIRNQNSEKKVAYLRKIGAKIGNGNTILCSTDAFGTEPYLIEVGDNCLFSGNIRIFTHDGGVSVLNNLNYFNGKKMDKIAPVRIGDNVYIGHGVMIMPGVTIGNNVVIGAGAIVTRDVPSNVVVAGVPAKCIKNIDEYYKSSEDRKMFYPTSGMSSQEKKEYLMSHIGNKDD